MPPLPVAGLLLAAGAGRRFGGPKALASDPDGTSWLTRSVGVLHGGGCDRVTVVLGAGADAARPLLAGLAEVDVVVADDWAAGMGASLRAGLAALAAAPEPTLAALVHLVDLPDVGPEVVTRLLGAVDGPAVLARAAYDAVPGHPVLLGRDHWPGVLATAQGDSGARAHLAVHDHALVECGDLATGRDRDQR